ncbi:glucose-1-phosphate adenylyltransferase subunit GlgD [Lachnoclostridium sp. Marseille-P6806]|uniref:glucose-1-phosphate adenylyltransferase subunit GlgD n=1 Tax=Lachnoclostridium sp. Marseille-P6806 TaxID=2364793 RepID=UPI00102F3E2C|nr:glucose-1-phosphate adenylyltransferase subunit GlgD [Lachnoclostridium sp. Marseille-P6806]
MATAFGIVTSSGSRFRVEGLQDHRPIGAFSFLGRYRVIDFPVSNLSNSNIDRIQVYVSQNPRSLAEHLAGGQHYNINSKRGKLQLLFNQDSRLNDIYNTDLSSYLENIEIIERMPQEYVILTPGYMVFTQDFNTLLEQHIESGADITLLYHRVDNAKTAYQNCNVLELNRQKGLNAIGPNLGTANERNIFMDTYIMKRELFVSLIRKGHKLSSVYTLSEVVNIENANLDIRGVPHRGYFAAICDFQSYYDANMELLDIDTARELFRPDWQIYTQTTDSCPTKYAEGASVRNSMIANGCTIEGVVENSVIGRGVTIRKGAVVRNCMILGHTIIDCDVHLEYQVIDKWAKIVHMKEIVASGERPGYIHRDDVL